MSNSNITWKIFLKWDFDKSLSFQEKKKVILNSFHPTSVAFAITWLCLTRTEINLTLNLKTGKILETYPLIQR